MQTSTVMHKRIEKANRQQIEMRIAALDDLIAEDHRVRIIWEMVEEMDLRVFYDHVEVVEGEAGRPAIDPKILVTLWLYATAEGVGSARALDRLCKEHIAYQWITGGVSVNYHTLADFRVKYETELDGILTNSVAVLMEEGIVKLERTAQDGIRVRASAGTSSFRRQERLEYLLGEAQSHVEALKEENMGEEISKRQAAARKRAAQERLERVKRSLEEIEKVKEQKARDHKKRSERKEPRCSTTDPEVRRMQMANGGYAPAYNGELTVDVESGIIVGVEVTNQVDQGQMQPMLEQIEDRYRDLPKEHLVDGGFVTKGDIEAAYKDQVMVYAPLPSPCKRIPHPEQIRASDGAGMKAWRERMVTEEAKEIYKQRCASIELINAQSRNRGLQQFMVRGMKKARAVLLWFVLVSNLFVIHRLRQAAAA